MRSVLVRPKAEEDLIGIWMFIVNENKDTAIADRFLRKLEDQFTTLLTHPKLGRGMDHLSLGIRILVFHNYLIVYSIVEDDIEIVRVLHGAQDRLI